MNYLQQLKAQKDAKDAYEADAQKMKELIFTINNYHAAYDGHFLNELDNFIKNYKPKKV